MFAIRVSISGSLLLAGMCLFHAFKTAKDPTEAILAAFIGAVFGIAGVVALYHYKEIKG